MIHLKCHVTFHGVAFIEFVGFYENCTEGNILLHTSFIMESPSIRCLAGTVLLVSLSGRELVIVISGEEHLLSHLSQHCKGWLSEVNALYNKEGFFVCPL